MEIKNIKDVEIVDVFCKDGLYTKYYFDKNNMKDIEKLTYIIENNFKIDFYCINCCREKLFITDEYEKIQKNINEYNDIKNSNLGFAQNDYVDYIKQNIIKLISEDNRNFSKNFTCSYCEQDKVIFHFRIEDNYLIKVGQFPSLADLTRDDTKEYKNILSRDDYSDLNRAIGLHSHGVGAGSLIYLRRIFENLIKKAYEESIREGTWDKEVDFYRIPMEDKIKNLGGYLPKFVSEHHFIYGILSKGIHELSEQDCIQYFDILRESIFIILDEEIKRVEEKKRIDNAGKALSKINSMLGEKK